jgi:hypothetical protein
MSEIERRAQEWETEVLPAFPRRRALYWLLPGPVEVSLAAMAVVAVISGQQWLLVVALVVAFYNLVHLYASDRWGVTCEIADHWVGDGEMPEGVTQFCPTCRDIPLRELWRGGRR